MDSEPLYSVQQIKVPDALPDILKEWTKEVIRANPADIIVWSAEYGKPHVTNVLAQT
jgi:hypothetical protein